MIRLTIKVNILDYIENQLKIVITGYICTTFFF
jgi:hypothetical protein